ncbi:MAG: hypothetical protein JWP03_2725, partial [Phycisphaerales bacterium]|nr:hypothetical protein [Phycisphaerales bacterium]
CSFVSPFVPFVDRISWINAEPRPRFQAQFPAYFIFAADVGPIFVMGAFAGRRFPPDTWPVLCDQIGFDLSCFVHLAL